MISMFILLIVCHTFHIFYLSLNELNRFPELSRTSSLFPGHSSPGKCHNKIPGLSRFSRTRANPVNNVSNWLTANGLFLNLKKTEYVVFGTRQRLMRSESDGPLCMEGKEVNQVKSFKYLGVLLDECLSSTIT